jgi:hypothetical protein
MPVTLEAEMFPYTMEEIKEEYVKDEGYVFSPVAWNPLGTGSATVASRVSQPQVFRTVTFTLQRIGKPPDIPTSCQARPGEVRAKQIVIPHARKELPDGNGLYGLEVRFLFRRLDGQFPVEYPESLTFQAPTSVPPPDLPAIT